jgi:HEPN domain-containing protein
MRPLAAEWLAKGRADLATARREARVRRQPNHDAACFHAQQAVEKLLKARMAETGMDIPRVHDLARLLDFLLPLEPMWATWRGALSELTAYSVEFRYPGESADKSMATFAVKTATSVCAEIEAALKGGRSG